MTGRKVLITGASGFIGKPIVKALAASGWTVRAAARDPAAIPDPQGKQVVFACRSGRRSITASVAAQDAGYPYSAHLAGGIIAWKAAGLPTKT